MIFFFSNSHTIANLTSKRKAIKILNVYQISDYVREKELNMITFQNLIDKEMSASDMMEGFKHERKTIR